MFKRFAAAVSLLVLSLVAGCGGGGGGSGDGGSAVSVTASPTSLQFSGISGEAIPFQNISLTLTNAPGTVYATAQAADVGVATASFGATGGTSGVISVFPIFSREPGTYQTSVVLRVYRNANATDLLASFTYPVTLTLLPGLSVNPTSLSLSTLQGNTAQGTLGVTLSPGVTGTVSAALAPGQAAAPWLGLSVNGNNTVQVNASAVSLAPGVYQRDLEVSVPRPSGALVVRVPLTFTVGVGLAAPADQTLALNAGTALASLGGTVNVARADGQSSVWTASTSAPWLVLTPNTGTTPSTLTYSVDPVQAGFLQPFTDATATVTLSTAGLTPVSFNVTLQNRLPYVSSAGPYGSAAGAPVRMVVGGRGFNQIADPVATLQLSGMNILSASVLSDAQIVANVSAQAGALPYTVRVPNAAGIVSRSAFMVFSSPFSYAPATVPHAGAKNIYLHDPVRRAVFALSRSGNALVRYKFDTVSGTWGVTSVPYNAPVNMALAPDGMTLWVTDTSYRVADVDPDTMAVRIYYGGNAGFSSNVGGVLPISSDGRMWLPGLNAHFDVVKREIVMRNTNVPFNLEFGSLHGSLDGGLVLIGPSFLFTPLPRFWTYDPVNGQITNPMGDANLGYEPRMSLDGSRTLVEGSGKLFDGNFALLGQLPTLPDNESHFLMTLTPDGSKILVLHKVYTNSSQSTLVSQSIDIYSTTAYAPASTDFAKLGSLPIGTDASICSTNSNDCLYGNQYLLPSVDSKTLFWIGNQNMQVFSIP
jgi:hypothetical protein